MKLMSRFVKVVVTKDYRASLDKWAIDTCYGELVRETLHLVSGKTEKLYRFRDAEMRQVFIDGLNANFGRSVELLHQ